MRRSRRALYDTGHVDISESVWSRGAAPTRFRPLEGDDRADVVVVGAGLAGSSLALHLAEQGCAVALVEAREPGWGASGRNAGHAVPYREVDRALAKLPDRGERFLELFRAGVFINPDRIADQYGNPGIGKIQHETVPGLKGPVAG